MSFDIYTASAPVMVGALTGASNWLDKALASGADEAALMEARLAPDMFAFPRQLQIATDIAKSGVAKLTGGEAPAMADTEASFAELKARLSATIAYIESIDRRAFEGAAEREVIVKFPNGMGYRFTGAQFLTGFTIPNLYFHLTTAYAILRASGVPMAKSDFLQHLGMPNL